MSLRLLLITVLISSAAVAGQVPRPGPPAPPVAPATPAGAGVIRGVVTDGGTGRPLRGVDIRIQGGTLGFLEARWARTDAQGRYQVTGLSAGRYTLTATKVGYLTLNYGQRRPAEAARPVDLSEATPLDKVDFALPRGGVIVGRVTDRYGDPVRGVSVRAYQYRFAFGERRLQQVSAGGSVTDDRGEQRIFGLPPGEYVVAASPALGASVRGDAETYHPGTVRVDEAQVVRLGVGEETQVTFPIVSVKRARLSGMVVGSSGGPLPNPSVSLSQSYLGSGGSRLMPIGPGGVFSEENLPPGDYTIEVRTPEWAVHRVRLFGDDLENLVVITKKPGDVRARVTFDGLTPPTESVDIRPAFPGPICGILRASCLGGSVGLVAAVAPTDWTFNAQLVGTGVLRLGRPATWFLKSVLVDGKDVTDTPLDFAAEYAGKPVEIVLTQRRAQVNGTVTDDRGQPIRDYVTVLFPEDEDQWTTFSRFIAVGRPDQQGRFALPGLPPGRYLLQAVDYLEPGEERNPETLARLRDGATSFSLSDGESRTVTVRMAP